ncbi:MAG: glycosyltransferase family 39 protein [candidate division WOR-3 bacterium]
MRIPAGILGGIFIFLAGLNNYTGKRWLWGDHWQLTGLPSVFFRLPGMKPDEAYYFPVLWLVAGLLVLLLLFGLAFPGFRRALIAPFRRLDTALPFVLALALLLFSLYPFDFDTAKQHETGAQLVLYLSLASAGFALLLFALYPGLRFADTPLNRLYRGLMNLPARRFLLLVCLLFLVLTGLISWFVFEHLPHVQDSISQLFQARIFATGRIHLTSPPFPDFFDYTHIINNGRWYSQYPWLHSFLLMLFVFLKAPWLLNPLCGTLTLPVIYLLGKELYDERTGRLGALLGLASPFIFNMSSEYMNHASALLFASLFLLFSFRTLRQSSPLNPLLAGSCLGLVANIRPYTALALGVPFAIYSLIIFFRAPRRYFLRLLILLLATLALTSLVFVYNWLANGSPTLFGYVVKWGPGHEIGFGHSGWGPPHTPYQGLMNTGNNLNLLNKFLFELPFPALLLILIPLARGTKNRNDRLLFATFLSQLVAYFFYWFHNLCFGPRFLYESSAALLLLGARGLITLPELLHRTFGLPAERTALHRFFPRALVLCLLFLAGIALPPLWREYHTYGGVSATVHKTVKRAGLNNALVFCDHFGNGFSYNRLTLDGPVVYCRNLGIFNPALTLRYPDRRCYFARHDTLIELKGLKYEGSPLHQTLLQLCRLLEDPELVRRYKTIIIPFADLPLPVDTAGFGDRITDFRTVSREIFQQRKTLRDYTPALALWIFNDEREHLQIFSMMDDPEHFIAGGLKFTLKGVAATNLGAVYDIRE